MIEWKKYDKENPPKLYQPYLTCNGKEVRSAWLDKHFHSDYPVWIVEDENKLENVTHYAEINIPEEYCGRG